METSGSASRSTSAAKTLSSGTRRRLAMAVRPQGRDVALRGILMAGSWYIVVMRPQESIVFGDDTNADFSVLS